MFFSLCCSFVRLFFLFCPFVLIRNKQQVQIYVTRMVQIEMIDHDKQMANNGHFIEISAFFPFNFLRQYFFLKGQQTKTVIFSYNKRKSSHNNEVWTPPKKSMAWAQSANMTATEAVDLRHIPFIQFISSIEKHLTKSINIIHCRTLNLSKMSIRVIFF